MVATIITNLENVKIMFDKAMFDTVITHISLIGVLGSIAFLFFRFHTCNGMVVPLYLVVMTMLTHVTLGNILAGLSYHNVHLVDMYSLPSGIPEAIILDAMMQTSNVMVIMVMLILPAIFKVVSVQTAASQGNVEPDRTSHNNR